MSQRTVHVSIKRFGDAITKDENNSKFPLKSLFLKVKEELDKVPLNDQDEIDLLRESVYDLEDLLSECQALLKKRIERRRRLLNCYSPTEFFFLNKTKIKLMKIKNMLQSLQTQKVSPREDKSQTGLPDTQSEYQWSCGAVDISKIYGWDDDVAEINKILVKEGHDGLNMVGIVGNYGTGKTALAQKIFMSEEVKDTFCLRLWVCVSPECDQAELIWRMLDNLGVEDIQSILDQKGERDELGVLLFLLHLQLLDKRYLIVFDDIWEVQDWHTNLDEQPPETKEWTDRLAYGLPKGNGSAIIVTSRVHEVAKRMVGRKNIYHPKRILDENGWLLFKDAFEEVRPFDESLESMKVEIIRKCDGLPLAIRTAGRELALIDASKLDADESSYMKPEEGDTNKPQMDNLTVSNVDESGESQGDDAGKSADNINKQDDDETDKQQIDSTCLNQPQDDDIGKPKVENIAESTQMDDNSIKSKIEKITKPSDDGESQDTKDMNSTSNKMSELDNMDNTLRR